MENFRGISFLCTVYKIYADILRCRLEKEMEHKDMLSESQAGFRKGRSTMDNIFVINHVIQREKEKEDKKVFVDLKAAFDNVGREVLWRIMEEKGVNKELLERIKEIYKETKIMIRTKEGNTKEFWTKRGVR